MNIALIEDNEVTQKYIVDTLSKSGFSIDVFRDGEKALEKMKEKHYKMIILDLNLPGMSGYDVMFFVKRNPEMYGKPKIIMLTSRITQEEVNMGLKSGADDYIKKPFNSEELHLRVNILAGRTKEEINLERIWYKDIFIDFEQSFIIGEDKEKIELTNKERQLLHYFFINQGLILSKEKIFREIWNEDYIPGNKNIEVYLSMIKRKVKILKDNIENYKNLGYRLKP